MCSSDGQRMFDAAAVGSLLAGGPLVAVLGVAYNLFILGPTSLLGSAVFILFYPTMVSNCAPPPPLPTLVNCVVPVPPSSFMFYTCWFHSLRYVAQSLIMHSGLKHLMFVLLKQYFLQGVRCGADSKCSHSEMTVSLLHRTVSETVYLCD